MNNKNNNLMAVLLQKATVFYILCPLLIVFCLLYVFYLVIFRGQAYETPFGVLFLLITAGVLGALWVLDRLLVNFVRPVTLSAVELLLMGGLWLWFSYSNREFIIDATASSGESFIIAYTIDDTLAEQPSDVFPFGKKMIILDRNYVILSDAYRLSEKNSFSPSFKPPASWGGGWQAPSVEFDLQDSRFSDLVIYLAPDRQPHRSLDEDRRITKAKVERAVNEFFTRVKQ